MKKLSELPNDTLLTVAFNKSDSVYTLYTKEELMNSGNLSWHKGQNHYITIAERITAEFDLYEALETNEEDIMYIGWTKDVKRNFDKANIDFKEINKIINAILEQNPTHYEGEEVEIDIVPQEMGEV